MATQYFLKIVFGFALASCLCFVNLNAFATTPPIAKSLQQDNNISITIDSKTTDANLESIKKDLKQYQITAKFTNIVRDESGTLTGINITLTDEQGGSASSQISSNTPLPALSFGKRDGFLFIEQEDMNFNQFSYSNKLFGSNTDSLLQQSFSGLKNFNLNDFFGNSDYNFFFNSDSTTLEALKEKITQHMQQSNLNSQDFSWFSKPSNSSKKYQFIDNPNTEKLIIIDGQKSDFKTLKTLADNDKIDTVDVLNAKPAMSIYGNKAKDGALIVTTK